MKGWIVLIMLITGVYGCTNEQPTSGESTAKIDIQEQPDTLRYWPPDPLVCDAADIVPVTQYEDSLSGFYGVVSLAEGAWRPNDYVYWFAQRGDSLRLDFWFYSCCWSGLSDIHHVELLLPQQGYTCMLQTIPVVITDDSGNSWTCTISDEYITNGLSRSGVMEPFTLHTCHQRTFSKDDPRYPNRDRRRLTVMFPHGVWDTLGCHSGPNPLPLTFRLSGRRQHPRDVTVYIGIAVVNDP